jgi:putative transposase
MHRKVSALFAPRWRDPSAWPQPSAETIKGHEESYGQRKRAVEHYLRGESLKSIKQSEGIDSTTLYGLLEACAEPDGDGGIMGFRALVPYTRRKAYERTQTVNEDALAAGRGAGGLFQQLLSKHAPLRALIEKQASKYAGLDSNRRIPIGKEHEAFLTLLVKLRGKKGYPFTTSNLGREGYRQALHAAIATRRGQRRGPLRESIERAFRTSDAPYRRIQIDAHRTDAFVKVRFVGRRGRFKIRAIRPWLVAAVEVDSGACLGWHLSVAREVSHLDILRCLYNMMAPWKRRTEFEVDTLEYKPGAGMPSGLFDRCAGRYADIVSLDNALCGHADRVRAVVLEKLHATLQYGLPGEPRTRSEIEQLFNTLTNSHVQHVVGGVHPNMSNRERAAAIKTAEERGMTIEQMEEYLEVTICNRNAHPTSAHYGKSPLAFLSEESPDTLVRADASSTAPWHQLLKIELSVPVRTGGHAPHINYLKASYTNDVLRADDGQVGKDITIVVNLLDLRTVEAHIPGGVSYGTLYAQGPWAQFVHDDRQRRQLNREIEDGNFYFEPGCDPEAAVAKFLRKVRRSAASKPKSKVKPPAREKQTSAPASREAPRTVAGVAKSMAFDIQSILGKKLKG